MIAVITGDIVNSGQYPSEDWLPQLKRILSEFGSQPKAWDIYRGDEFQLKIPAERALEVAVLIKAVIRSVKGLDVRLAIGLGEESYSGERITEANGTAYQNSGRLFADLKTGRQSIALRSGHEERDRVLNLLFRLALSFMDEWTPVSAETVAWTLRNPSASQQEMAERFGIQQSAVSQRQKRARTELVLELLEFYSTLLKD